MLVLLYAAQSHNMCHGWPYNFDKSVNLSVKHTWACKCINLCINYLENKAGHNIFASHLTTLMNSNFPISEACI